MHYTSKGVSSLGLHSDVGEKETRKVLGEKPQITKALLHKG